MYFCLRSLTEYTFMFVCVFLSYIYVLCVLRSYLIDKIIYSHVCVFLSYIIGKLYIYILNNNTTFQYITFGKSDCFTCILKNYYIILIKKHVFINFNI